MVTSAYAARVAVIVALLAVVIGGSAAIGALDQVIGPDAGAASNPNAEALVDDVLSAEGELETLVATRNRTTIVNPANGSPMSTVHVDRVWQDAPARFRTEVLEGDPPIPPGRARLVDGPTLTIYSPYTERVTRASGWEDDLLQHPEAGILDEFEAEYRGTESIDGRETHVVVVEPAPNSTTTAALSLQFGNHDLDLMTAGSRLGPEPNVTIRTTWWIDTEVPFPLKERIEIHTETEPGDPSLPHQIIETTYTDVRLNEPVPHDRFTVKPPRLGYAGTSDDSTPDEWRVWQADENGELPVAAPEPTVPDEFSLGHLSAAEAAGRATVVYHFVADLAEDAPPGTEERAFISVQIRDQADLETDSQHRDDQPAAVGTVVSVDRWTAVIWRCGGLEFHVRVDSLENHHRDLAIAVAQSIDCDRPR